MLTLSFNGLGWIQRMNEINVLNQFGNKNNNEWVCSDTNIVYLSR